MDDNEANDSKAKEPVTASSADELAQITGFSTSSTLDSKRIQESGSSETPSLCGSTFTTSRQKTPINTNFENLPASSTSRIIKHTSTKDSSDNQTNNNVQDEDDINKPKRSTNSSVKSKFIGCHYGLPSVINMPCVASSRPTTGTMNLHEHQGVVTTATDSGENTPVVISNERSPLISPVRNDSVSIAPVLQEDTDVDHSINPVSGPSCSRSSDSYEISNNRDKSNVASSSSAQNGVKNPKRKTALTSIKKSQNSNKTSSPKPGNKRKTIDKMPLNTEQGVDDSRKKRQAAPNVDLEVEWSLEEKKKLLEALETDEGRRWWGRLAAKVGTKNVDQVKHYTEILRAQANDTPPIHLEEVDNPLQAWIVACEQFVECQDDVDAKCIPQVMTIAAVEPVSSQGSPVGPNYNRIYTFLSGVLRGQPAVALSPVDAKVVLELLHGLETKVSAVNTSEQVNFLRTKFKNIFKELEQEQLAFAMEELLREVTQAESQTAQHSNELPMEINTERTDSSGTNIDQGGSTEKSLSHEKSSNDSNSQKTRGADARKKFRRNEQGMGQSSLNPINVPVSLLNLVNKK